MQVNYINTGIFLALYNEIFGGVDWNYELYNYGNIYRNTWTFDI